MVHLSCFQSCQNSFLSIILWLNLVGKLACLIKLTTTTACKKPSSIAKCKLNRHFQPPQLRSRTKTLAELQSATAPVNISACVVHNQSPQSTTSRTFVNPPHLAETVHCLDGSSPSWPRSFYARTAFLRSYMPYKPCMQKQIGQYASLSP